MRTLSLIEFLSPLFLLAALAAVIPLIIHMLQRQQAKEKRFSTLRFLKLSVEKTARRRRLRDLLLLLLRMAAVVALAIALARPFLKAGTRFFGNRGLAVVVVLDNSPSMAVADGGEVRFERARSLALQVLDQLKSGDEAGLLLTGGPSQQQDLLYKKIENVQRLIEQASVCLSKADLPAAISRAKELLKKSDLPNKEIYVVTDLQRSGWLEQAAPIAQPQSSSTSEGSEPSDGSEAEIPIIIVDVHRGRPNNAAVESLERRVAVPAVGVPVRILATVRNLGPSEQSLQAELTVDGQPVEQTKPVPVGPGDRYTFEFVYRPEKAGVQEAVVSLVGEDSSPLDDQRYFVLDTQSTVEVALVDERTEDLPAYRTASYYLERALRPIREGQYAVKVSVLKPELLAEEPLTNYSAVFCVDLPPLDESALEALTRYVANGGTLFWICGPNNDPEQMTGSPLFPGKFSFPDQPPASGWHWNFLDKKHPALTPLCEPPTLYLNVTVEQYLKLTLPEESEARVLARLNNGDPVLVSHPVVNGTVYTLTCGAHAEWTTLPLRPIFVPLVNRLVLHSAQRDRGPLEVPPGNPAVFRFAGESQPVTVEVVLPQGAGRVRMKSKPAGEFQELRFANTHRAGIYHVKMVEAQHPRNYAFAVNFDSAEADPDFAALDELNELLGQTVFVATDEATLADTIRRLHQGTPLMDWFLVLVLLVGVLEVLVANRMNQEQPLPLEEEKRSSLHEILRRAQTVHHLEAYTHPGTTNRAR